ncbi:hypothetical protein [Natronosalvus amylolyticus]|uniref:hypothetical protein n=1 Tax=Natronosalvus amylolyticus TaxID=2961994 RepID=UPI0020C9436E|nr:hypothetical protein [Natronosalvus amylolyticus]
MADPEGNETKRQQPGTRLRGSVPVDWRVGLCYATSGFIALSLLVDVLASGSIPWASILVVAVAIVACFGPLAWFARVRIAPTRRATLRLVAGGVSLLALPFALTALLRFSPWPGSFQGIVLGVFIGSLVVVALERTAVPELVVAVTG